MLSAVAVGGVSTLAGCSGSGGSSAAFESVKIDGERLVVQLASEGVKQGNVIGPNGALSLGSTTVATGQVQTRPLFFGADSPFECGTAENATLTVRYQGMTDQHTIPIAYAVTERNANSQFVGDQIDCNITVVERF